MLVCPEPAPLETGHSDGGPRVVAFLAESKAGGIRILGIGCRVCCWYWCRSGIPGANELGKANPTPARNFTGWQLRLCGNATPSAPFQHPQAANSRNSWTACARVVWNRLAGVTAEKKRDNGVVFVLSCAGCRARLSATGCMHVRTAGQSGPRCPCKVRGLWWGLAAAGDKDRHAAAASGAGSRRHGPSAGRSQKPERHGLQTETA